MPYGLQIKLEHYPYFENDDEYGETFAVLQGYIILFYTKSCLLAAGDIEFRIPESLKVKLLRFASFTVGQVSGFIPEGPKQGLNSLANLGNFLANKQAEREKKKKLKEYRAQADGLSGNLLAAQNIAYDIAIEVIKRLHNASVDVKPGEEARTAEIINRFLVAGVLTSNSNYGYSAIVDNASMVARDLANNWASVSKKEPENESHFRTICSGLLSIPEEGIKSAIEFFSFVAKMAEKNK